MIKLKKLLKESKYAFDRKFGEPLPTFKGVMEKHQEETVDEAKPRMPAMFVQTFDKLLKKQTKGKLPTVKDIEKVFDLMRKRYGQLESVELSEASASTGWRLYRAPNIDSKLWESMKYDLRDQFKELVKIGADYGVFENAQGNAKILKQIKRLMDKIS